MPSSKYETLPVKQLSGGVLHIWPASAHTPGKISQCGTVLDHQSGESLFVQFGEVEMATVVNAMRNRLPTEELRQSKPVLLADGCPLTN